MHPLVSIKLYSIYDLIYRSNLPYNAKPESIRKELTGLPA